MSVIRRLASPSRYRWVAVTLTALLGLGLIFGLLFIDTRDGRRMQQSERDYGELLRIERLLHDMVATVVTIAAQSDGSQPIGPMRIETLREGQAKCKAEAPAAIRLCADPQDKQLRVELAVTPAKQAIAYLGPLIEAQGIDSRVRQVAIIDDKGEVLLPLRGDAPLPPNLRARLEPRSESARKAAKDAEAQAAPGEIALAGSTYAYYEVPLDLSDVASIGPNRALCAPRKCSLAALVAVAGFADDFRSVSPMTRAIFAGLLFLFLLSIPVLKLVTIDRNASLHWLDVAAIGLTVPLIVAVLTILLLIVGHWNGHRARAEQTSREFAAYLATNVTTEIKNTQRDMRSLLRMQPPQAQPIPIDGMRLFDKNGVGVALPNNFVPYRVLPLRPKIEDESQTTAPTSQSSPTVPNSDAGWITRRVPLAPANPKDRAFFQRLLSGKSMPFVPSEDATGAATANVSEAQVIDQVRSIADGASKLVIAHRADLSAANVLIAIKRLAATVSLPAPAGFGFALINPDSRAVLHHSDPLRAHVDSFAPQFRRYAAFDIFRDRMTRQCAANAEQRPGSPVLDASDRDDFTTIRGVRYSGVKVNMTLFPICAAGWMGAIWYEVPTLQTLPMEVGALAGAMVLLHTLALGGLALLLALPAGKKHFRWLWPSPALEHESTHRRMLWIALGWAAFSFAAMALIAGDALLLHALGCTLILVHLARTVLGGSAGEAQPGESPDANSSDRLKQRLLDWTPLVIGAALVLAAAGIGMFHAVWPTIAYAALAKNLGYALLFVIILAIRFIWSDWLVGPPRDLSKGGEQHAPRKRDPKRIVSQRRQAILIIQTQAAALLVFGVLPATAAYLAAWDARRLVDRDADILRFEAAQLSAARDIADTLSDYKPRPRLCRTGGADDLWAPWAGYFRDFQTDADPSVHQQGLARNALRRWRLEPARIANAAPDPLANPLLGLPPCSEA